jgi:hypothetical protein
MTTVVFTGLSVDAATASAFGVRVLPPVRRGDIDTLLTGEERPARIGVVDGSFLQGLMISPKEVLRALDAGVEVAGSSSIGALRAAELDGYGMRGVGRVYEMYRSGEVDGDDEVAVTFDPESHRVMCEPMVGIRVALAAAVQHGALEEGLARTATRIAKDLYFPDRSYARLLHELAAAVPGADLATLRHFLDHEAPDVKRADAIALLESLC